VLRLAATEGRELLGCVSDRQRKSARAYLCRPAHQLVRVSADYRTGSSSVTEVRAWPSALQCHPKLGYVAVGMVDGTLEIVGNH